MRVPVRRTVALGLAMVLASCGDDDGFTPTVDNVAGSYAAVTFTASTFAGTVDLLALGSQLTATLAPNGSVTGRLFIPGGGEDGEDVDEDLTGTWTLSGSTVTFDHVADTFIREVDFAVSQNRLTAEGTIDQQMYRLVLAKSE